MDDEDYEIATWFKVCRIYFYHGNDLIAIKQLHLHPESMKVSDLPPSYGSLEEFSQIEIPELPQNTTLSQIYSEFIQYLYTMTKKFFKETLPNGQNVWGRLESSIVMIFCIPNGWDISQQAFIREAVINTGLVSQSNADERIEFITEGEASVHYVLAHTSGMRWLEEKTMFTVIDAGG
ncbi:5640_t:CDS:1, partial [Acaulospora colombiana]